MNQSPPECPQPGPASPLVDAALDAAPGGTLPFPEFMAIALYGDPGGYYRTPREPLTGRRGDFFTSVSVGPCFGFLLAHFVATTWREQLGAPGQFTLLEAGANDGQLTADILAALPEIDPACATAVRPVIVEQSAPAREQASTKVPSATVLPELPPADAPSSGSHAIVLANELLDALPVHLVRFEDGTWHELHVARHPDGHLHLVPRPVTDPPLAARTAALGTGFPDGYTTEVNLAAPQWLTSAAARFQNASFLLLDYGYPADDYYAPHRTAGTLRTYAAHRAGDDPLDTPGARDITAHVDFTALADAAAAVGLHLEPLEDQHHFLTRLAVPWLKSLEADPEKFAAARDHLRQFQTLTHPASMGRQFKVFRASTTSPPPGPHFQAPR